VKAGPPIVAPIYVGTVLEELMRDVGVAMSRRNKERGPAGARCCTEIWICSGFQQCMSDVSMAPTGRLVQRSIPKAAGDINLGPSSQEKFYDCHGSSACCAVQRCVTARTAVIDMTCDGLIG